MRADELLQASSSEAIFAKMGEITDELRNEFPDEEIDEVFARHPEENLKMLGLTLLLIPILPAEVLVGFLSRFRKKSNPK